MRPEADTSLAGKDLRKTSLRGADLTGKVLFGADLRESDLYGAQISLCCQTFDGVKLDNAQVAMLLMMLSQADIDPRYLNGIRALVQDVAGQRAYEVMLRILRLT